MSYENSDLPAFPSYELSSYAQGLTKREYFAGRIMHAMCTDTSRSRRDLEQIASFAVIGADALLAELAKE